MGIPVKPTQEQLERMTVDHLILGLIDASIASAESAGFGHIIEVYRREIRRRAEEKDAARDQGDA